MTPLNRPVSRATRLGYPVLYREPAQIIVTLLPGDLIEFRHKRCKSRWTLPLDECFKHAVFVQARRALLLKRKARKEAKP